MRKRHLALAFFGLLICSIVAVTIAHFGLHRPELAIGMMLAGPAVAAMLLVGALGALSPVAEIPE